MCVCVAWRCCGGGTSTSSSSDSSSNAGKVSTHTRDYLAAGRGRGSRPAAEPFMWEEEEEEVPPPSSAAARGARVPHWHDRYIAA